MGCNFNDGLNFTRAKISRGSEGAAQVPIGGLDDKRNVRLGLSFSGNKVLLKTQIIYEGKTDLCHTQFDFPDHMAPTHSESHWSTEQTIIQYIEESLHPYICDVCVISYLYLLLSLVFLCDN